MNGKVVTRNIVDVPLEQIIVSKTNMRQTYDPEKIDELVHSINRIGQIYPVLLHRLREDKYELVIGSRRFNAVRKSHARVIPATILEDLSDQEMVILSLTENLHHNDLTPFEEARGILRLCTEHGMQPKEVSRKLHKPLPWVKGRLKILSVPEPVQNLLCENKVTLNYVGILASLGNSRDQIRYANVVAKQSLSEEDLTMLIREEVKGVRPERPASRKIFTPMRLALKVKSFHRFFKNKVRPQLALGGSEAVEVRRSLRELRETIKELLSGKISKN